MHTFEESIEMLVKISLKFFLFSLYASDQKCFLSLPQKLNYFFGFVMIFFCKFVGWRLPAIQHRLQSC